MLLISFQGASAAVQTTSGSTPPMGNTLPRGTTSYVVSYSYPSTAQVGTNLTIALTLRVISLGGIVQYTSNYDLEALVFIGTHLLNGSVHSPAGAPNLYPGSSWGPNNVTIPLTAENTGLAKGESANATIGIILNDYVFYGAPISVFEPESPMQGQGGSLVIENAVSASSSTSGLGFGAGQTYLPYLLLASGALILVAAVYFLRGPRSPRADQK
jgi:hypothetical protein